MAFITGNGLKTQEAVESLVDPVHTAPDYEAFETALAALRARWC